MVNQSDVEACPRCGERLRAFPEDVGALSRSFMLGGEVTICGPCGDDEVRRQVTFGRAPPKRPLLPSWVEPDWGRAN